MTRHKWTYGLLWFCLVLFSTGRPLTAFADEHTQLFLKAIRLYEKKDYAGAVDAFSKIADHGIQNAKLYYNLANAHLKNGDIGPAVLWYERALKLMPNDPDLRFNLDYAKTLITDKKEPSSPLMTVLFFWKDLFSATVWQWLALLWNAFFWIALAAWYGFKKRAFRTMSACLLVATCIALGTVCYHKATALRRPGAIILPPSVSVRSGFSPESTELFVLHAGTRVAVEKQTKGYYRIRFSKDKIGWVEDTMAGII